METDNKWLSALCGNHRRRIRVTLSHLDEVLCQFERWAQGREFHSVLYLERNALTAEQKAEILTAVSGFRKALTELRDVLGLSQKVEDVTSRIWSHCSSLWGNLVELESEHLRRYGDLPAGFPEYMDPKIETLIQYLNRILEVIKKPL